jgi:hypothetical protein
MDVRVEAAVGHVFERGWLLPPMIVVVGVTVSDPGSIISWSLSMTISHSAVQCCVGPGVNIGQLCQRVVHK